MRASSPIPGVISPVGIEGTEYEDGDESLPLAVRAARQAGEDEARRLLPALQLKLSQMHVDIHEK